jgi:hypothetical protein
LGADFGNIYRRIAFRRLAQYSFGLLDTYPVDELIEIPYIFSHTTKFGVEKRAGKEMNRK